MIKKGNAVVITLILVVVALGAGVVAYRLLGNLSRSAYPGGGSGQQTTTASPTRVPSPTTTALKKVDSTDAGLDSQISDIQNGLTRLDGDQKAYVQIDQSADTNYTLP